MMRFLIGVVVGALGYWVYEQNRASGQWSNEWSSTEPWKASEPSMASQSSAASESSPIIRPTAQEVAGRPSEPIPS